MNGHTLPASYHHFCQIIRGDDGAPAPNIYVLLDCACDERIHPEIVNSGLAHQCLYPGVLSEGLSTVAPYLVKLEQQSEFSKWIFTEGWGNNWGIYLTAEGSSFVNLLHHFQQMIRVRDEHNKVLFFRFYDPRVLRVYLPTCLYGELTSFFGDVKNFYTEDDAAMNVLGFRFDGESLRQRMIEIAPLA